MELGEVDGFGRFGVVDETVDGLLCHECGSRFTHLGLHAWRRHGLTANEYRFRHGLASQYGLVAKAVLAVITENARRTLKDKPRFIAARDPAAATAARLAAGLPMSPAGLAASRSRKGRGRRGTVVVCEGCGVSFCPLTAARRRRFCSRSCAGKANRARMPETEDNGR